MRRGDLGTKLQAVPDPLYYRDGPPGRSEKVSSNLPGFDPPSAMLREAAGPAWAGAPHRAASLFLPPERPISNRFRPRPDRRQPLHVEPLVRSCGGSPQPAVAPWLGRRGSRLPRRGPGGRPSSELAPGATVSNDAGPAPLSLPTAWESGHLPMSLGRAGSTADRATAPNGRRGFPACLGAPTSGGHSELRRGRHFQHDAGPAPVRPVHACTSITAHVPARVFFAPPMGPWRVLVAVPALPLVPAVGVPAFGCARGRSCATTPGPAPVDSPTDLPGRRNMSAHRRFTPHRPAAAIVRSAWSAARPSGGQLSCNGARCARIAGPDPLSRTACTSGSGMSSARVQRHRPAATWRRVLAGCAPRVDGLLECAGAQLITTTPARPVRRQAPAGPARTWSLTDGFRPPSGSGSWMGARFRLAGRPSVGRQLSVPGRSGTDFRAALIADSLQVGQDIISHRGLLRRQPAEAPLALGKAT